jgi:hypothetical protein
MTAAGQVRDYVTAESTAGLKTAVLYSRAFKLLLLLLLS